MDKYLKCYETLHFLALSEFVANCNLNEKDFKKWRIPLVIWYVIYNKHQDRKNYYQAWLLLFHPCITSEESQLGKLKSWHNAYLACASPIYHVHSKFFFKFQK